MTALGLGLAGAQATESLVPLSANATLYRLVSFFYEGVVNFVGGFLLETIHQLLFFRNPWYVSELNTLWFGAMGLFHLIFFLQLLVYFTTFSWMPVEDMDTPWTIIERYFSALIIIIVSRPFLALVIEIVHLISRALYPAKFSLTVTPDIINQFGLLVGASGAAILALLAFIYTSLGVIMLVFFVFLGVRMLFIYMVYALMPILMAFWIIRGGMWTPMSMLPKITFKAFTYFLGVSIFIAAVLGTGGAIATTELSGADAGAAVDVAEPTSHSVDGDPTDISAPKELPSASAAIGIGGDHTAMRYGLKLLGIFGAMVMGMALSMMPLKVIRRMSRSTGHRVPKSAVRQSGSPSRSTGGGGRIKKRPTFRPGEGHAGPAEPRPQPTGVKGKTLRGMRLAGGFFSATGRGIFRAASGPLIPADMARRATPEIEDHPVMANTVGKYLEKARAERGKIDSDYIELESGKHYYPGELGNLIPGEPGADWTTGSQYVNLDEVRVRVHSTGSGPVYQRYTLVGPDGSQIEGMAFESDVVDRGMSIGQAVSRATRGQLGSQDSVHMRDGRVYRIENARLEQHTYTDDGDLVSEPQVRITDKSRVYSVGDNFSDGASREATRRSSPFGGYSADDLPENAPSNYVAPLDAEVPGEDDSGTTTSGDELSGWYAMSSDTVTRAVGEGDEPTGSGGDDIYPHQNRLVREHGDGTEARRRSMNRISESDSDGPSGFYVRCEEAPEDRWGRDTFDEKAEKLADKLDTPAVQPGDVKDDIRLRLNRGGANSVDEAFRESVHEYRQEYGPFDPSDLLLGE